MRCVAELKLGARGGGLGGAMELVVEVDGISGAVRALVTRFL
jgi:hypothetical protein